MMFAVFVFVRMRCGGMRMFMRVFCLAFGRRMLMVRVIVRMLVRMRYFFVRMFVRMFVCIFVFGFCHYRRSLFAGLKIVKCRSLYSACICNDNNMERCEIEYTGQTACAGNRILISKPLRLRAAWK